MRTWQPKGAVDVRATLAVHGRGPYDPAHQVTSDGAVWRTCRTPDGPATVRVGARDGDIEATAWGAGGPWLIDALPDWLGAADDPAAFRPQHRVLEHAVRRHAGLRIGHLGLVMEALVPAILEQKVTTIEASRSWQALMRSHGVPAPGPVPDGMRVIPAPDELRMIPSWEWHRAGVGPERSRTIVCAARVARRLEEAAAMPSAEAAARLQTVPRIGPWTAAEVIQRVHGDPDMVSVGDAGLPGLVAYNLAGERTADDARMLELLEPYRGQRYRACLFLVRFGHAPPRRAPRQPLRDYRRF